MNRFVLIADILKEEVPMNITNTDLECADLTYFNDINSALSEISSEVVHYEGPSDFLNNISKHKNDIVLSIWSGSSNINRKVLIPSICEAYNIRYIGADPYVQFTCQDKTLSKYICSKYDIKSAKGVLVKNVSELSALDMLKSPLVVKPNFEGGSIGISKNSVCLTLEKAKELTVFLLKAFHQPILVEEYLKGKEICVTIAGKNNHIDVLEADEIVLEDNTTPFPMFGFEAKKANTIKCHRLPATHLLDKELTQKFTELFLDLGKVDVMRIDGKIDNGCFKLIELSPDTHLGKSASTAYAFSIAGYTYTDMFRLLESYV